MKHKTSVFSAIFISFLLLGNNFICSQTNQNERKSSNGYLFPTTGEYKIMNIFIDIIYDMSPDKNPCKEMKIKNTHWKAGAEEGINKSLPPYIYQILDLKYPENKKYKGIMTRLYAESSFDSLILLGDFIQVSIKQSTVSPKDGKFSWKQLVDSCISMINHNGGFLKNSIGNSSSLSEFDKMAYKPGNSGLDKKTPNKKIDLIQLFLRNSRPGYGTIKIPNGRAGTNVFPKMPLYDNDTAYFYDMGTLQAVSIDDISLNPKHTYLHEFSHTLLGDNSFHCAGGHHYRAYPPISVFLGLNGGHGLLGGPNSGLVSCNAVDRWRLDWRSPSNNAYRIAANGIHADISKNDSVASFTLRDFVQYGDAIRIKLPYVDENSPNQYIWIENHQIGLHNKLDYLQYSNTHECRDKGTSGIYMYYQVAKDKIEGSLKDIYGGYSMADYIKPISAQGNWDMELADDLPVRCVAWEKAKRAEYYLQENPLSGVSDQNVHFFNTYSDTLSLKDDDWPWSVITATDDTISNLVHLGDNRDAFTGNKKLTLATNPATVPVITYFCRGKSSTKKFTPVEILPTGIQNNRTIYLSGLGIEMIQQKEGLYSVNISWDNYAVNEDILWTGTICLKEKLIVEKNTTITIAQNITPSQLYRDSLSGVFAPTSVFIIDSNAQLHLQKGAKMNIEEKSTCIIKKGAHLVFERNAEINIKKSSQLIFEDSVIIDAAKKSGIIVSDGAFYRLDSSYENEVPDYIQINKRAINGLNITY